MRSCRSELRWRGLLQFGEEVLDEVTRLIEVAVVGALDLAIGPRRDDVALAGCLERAKDALVCAQRFVGDQRLG